MNDDRLKRRSDELGPTMVGWRRELHQHPELGFEERRTAAFVAARLEELGLEIKTGLAVTGVVGVLRAARPDGPAVLLRADMDGLPIQEVEGREYGSKVAGRMHACGHDGHMAMLLGAATMLVDEAEALRRDVVFCFQPGEEGMGGAKRMLDDGLLDWVEIGSAYALHLWSPFACGGVWVRSGPIMAAQDEFTARIVGSGGHGAEPHSTRDPIVAASQAVTALQSIVSRSIDPLEAAVVTIGSLHAGSAANIIPDEAELVGTMRSFTEEVRETLRTRLREVLDGVARAAGCRLKLDLRHGYPATVNDARAVETARRAAGRAFGEANVHEPAPLAASEDFSYILRERPGAFVLVGAGNAEREITAPHHSPRFDIDESALPRGAEMLTRIALEGGSAG